MNTSYKRLLLLTVFLFTFLNASTLNLSTTFSPSRLNPILANDSASSKITSWIFNGLLKYDKNGNIIPDLASDFKFITNTKLIINLKKNVLWHDGKEFTSKDVVFTYDSIMNPKVFTSITSTYNKVKTVKALNDYTVEITYTEPYFKALENWMVGIIPFHLLKDEKDLMRSEFNKKPIGTGSYKLESFKNSSDIKLIANDNYFDGRPRIDEIHYKFLPDPTTSFLMLKQGKLDVGNLTPLQMDRQINDSFKKNYQIIEQQSNVFTYLGFNLRNKKFKNKKVREALSLAVNRKELVDILFFGHGQICHGPFLPGSFAFNKECQLPKYNMQKAKEMLAEAGYDKNNPLEFEVVTNTGNETRINAAEVIQYQLAKVGVIMKIRVMEWQAFLNTIVKPHNFEAVILAWSLGFSPNAYTIWHSKSDKKGGFNFIGYHNNQVDKLIDKGSSTINREELAVIYKKLFRLISNDTPYLFLYIPNSITAINNNIQNKEPALIGIMHNQKDWVKLQKDD